MLAGEADQFGAKTQWQAIAEVDFRAKSDGTLFQGHDFNDDDEQPLLGVRRFSCQVPIKKGATGSLFFGAD
jgi:hypothetical protein